MNLQKKLKKMLFGKVLKKKKQKTRRSRHAAHVSHEYAVWQSHTHFRDKKEKWVILLLTVWTVKQRRGVTSISWNLHTAEGYGSWVLIHKTFLAALRFVRWLCDGKLNFRTGTDNWKYDYPWFTVKSSSHVFFSCITADQSLEHLIRPCQVLLECVFIPFIHDE